MALPNGLKVDEALEYIAARLFAIEMLLSEIYPTFAKSDMTPIFDAEIESTTLAVGVKSQLKTHLQAHKNKLPKKG